MSGLSDHLRSSQTGAPVGCGGIEEKGCVGGLEGLEGPELWTREFGLQDGSLAHANDQLGLVTPNHYPPPPAAPELANGLHLQRRAGHGTYRRRQPDAAAAETLAETLRNMQTHIDPDVHEQGASRMDSCGRAEVNSVGQELPMALISEAVHTPSPQPLPLELGNHPAPTGQLDIPVLTAEIDISSNFCPISSSPNPNASSSPLPVEVEKKYALRSSGRPRFPCHLRKSSRLRRSTEDGEKRAGRDDDDLLEDKVWRIKEEEVAIIEKEEHHPSVEAVLAAAAAPCPADIALALAVPSKPMPKAVPKPAGPRLGHRPGPKSRSRPVPKSVQKAAPKSVMRQRQAAQSAANRGAHHIPFPSTPPVAPPRLPVKKEEPVAQVEVLPPNGRRRGRFVGVRRIVVKVARIPVSISRRQKSYKISNVETVSESGKGNEGSVEGAEAAREPTALLRMKNNGKSVMVMFPPGELPVILKRRRGRPPKQAAPAVPGEPPAVPNPAGTTDPVKKPRRRRRTKLPSPYPSYVNDTNDVKTEYGDVLSKLAFLNRQPPATGRCSPPRCWTPSEPESFHAPLENPGISTLLHRLTGFRRPRGGRGGGVGRGGGGAAGGIGGSERNKSTFSDFFESIGKKRKQSPLSEHGLPRKRGKGVGGVGRGGGVIGAEPGGEKAVRKRRVRKNGAFKGEGGCMGADWPNGAGGWGEEGCMDKEKGLGGYQLCGSPRGGFSSCEVGRGGLYGGPGGGRGAGPPGGDDSQGLFAGYFRSLLDSDDSSDLLDISSSQGNSRKASSAAIAAAAAAFEPSSTAPGHSWSPGFPKWAAKGAVSAGEASAQAARPPYSYGSLSQTSPTPSAYPKPIPLSPSHSPSSPRLTSYGHFSTAYSSSSPAGVAQRSPDCSFAYSSGKATPLGQMAFSNYHAKRGYGGYPAGGHPSMARGESTGPTSPGGGYMSVAKGSPFSSSSSPEGYKQYNSNQWSYRQGYGSCWSTDMFGPQYHGYGEYGSSESKDILDISNYTPQKAKRQPFPESLSESSSDSSHLGSVATGSGPSSMGAIYKQSEVASVGSEGGQSSLSSLEKLMIDWHESASAPSYNWSQNVLFQGGGNGKPGRGRRKRTEQHSDKEGGSGLHSDSPSSPSPTPTPGPKRGGVGGRGRGSRGSRGGLSSCQRERPSGAKGRAKAASGVGGAGSAGGLDASGLFQEGLDYYSGDSSSLSPLATPTPAPPSSYLQDPCEYPSPYSAHPSTPSSEERYPALYPGESSSSLSPSVSSPPYPPKPTPPPPQSYHLAPSRNFSPSCSPLPRVTPHCGTALSPSHRPPPKDPQFSQYDSPSYCSSPYWYGQTSHSGSPSPHSNTAVHAQGNPHTSPHGNTLASPGGGGGGGGGGAHMTPTPHDTHHHNAQGHAGLGSHAKPYAATAHLSLASPHANSQPHHNAHTNAHLPTHVHSAPSPSLHPHSASLLYEERSPPSVMAAHKQDLVAHAGQRPGALPHSPYPKAPVDSSPHQEDASGYALSHQSCQGMGLRYPSQTAQGGGVLCQLLDPTNDDSFSVTSL